ncbi:MAG: hypothetical protein ACC628_17335 [Pirellulaceae bacterium]
MSSDTPTPDDRPEYDPVFLNSRREAILIFFLWLAGFVWAVPFCYLTGYIDNYDPETFTTTLGVPTWLFWGIAVPWLVADFATTWFCFCYMKDDDLGHVREESAAECQSPELPAQDAETEA